MAQYAAKRKKLEGDCDDQNKPSEERFAARLKLAQLPRNSSATRVRNRCELTGRARGYYRKLKVCRQYAARTGEPGAHPRHDQGELVRR